MQVKIFFMAIVSIDKKVCKRWFLTEEGRNSNTNVIRNKSTWTKILTESVNS